MLRGEETDKHKTLLSFYSTLLYNFRTNPAAYEFPWGFQLHDFHYLSRLRLIIPDPSDSTAQDLSTKVKMYRL